VDIKRVQEWLGHHSAAFTLDIYGHLMPDGHAASLRQVEAIFAAALRSALDGPEAAQPGGRAIRGCSRRSGDSRTLPVVTWAGT
jgi:hypothetical protein